MALSLFVGIPVSDYAAALPWYVALLGAEPTFVAHATECVWDVADDRSVYIVEMPEHAGHARLMLFVDDLDAVVDAVAGRGIEPVRRETYDGGVRKVSYADADGNEVAYGGYTAG